MKLKYTVDLEIFALSVFRDIFFANFLFPNCLGLLEFASEYLIK